MGQGKLYKAGQTPKGGGPKVTSGTQQGQMSKRQSGQHGGKDRNPGKNTSSRGNKR